MEKVTILTRDQGKKLDPADQAFRAAAETGEGLVKIESKEQLMELAHMAKERMEEFQLIVREIVTPERAELIRNLRVNEDYSWRALAAECHKQFNGEVIPGWHPASNQLMGMALCEAAAKYFNEDHRNDPWN